MEKMKIFVNVAVFQLASQLLTIMQKNSQDVSKLPSAVKQNLPFWVVGKVK